MPMLRRLHRPLTFCAAILAAGTPVSWAGDAPKPQENAASAAPVRSSRLPKAQAVAKVNEELGRGRDVRVNVLPREEAFAIPDLIRTKVNLLPEGIEEIRTIEIVGLDLQADGGTHVANTREVGGIRVTGYESKGRINKRIRIELADPA